MHGPSTLSLRNQNMGFDRQPAHRRRRRHDILFDGCGVLAQLFLSICSSIHEVNLSLDCISDDPSFHANRERETAHESRESSAGLENPATLRPCGLCNDPSLSATDTVDIHERANPSTPVSHVPSTEKQVNGDYLLPDFKVTDSASNQPIDLSLDSLANDPSPTASTTEAIHEGLNQSSLASQMPPISNEVNSYDQLLSFKNLQFVGNLVDTLSDHDLNYTTSSSCKDHRSLLNFLASDIGTTTMDTCDCETLNFSELDPADSEANGNEVARKVISPVNEG